MLGWALHLPYVSPKGKILESEVQLDLTMGPSISITGDVVWDQSQGRSKDPKLRVKLAAILSTQETLVTKTDARQLEEELGGEALSNLRQSAIGGLGERAVQAKQHAEQLSKVEGENEKLRQDVEELKKELSKPTEKAIKTSAENQEIEKAKEYYLNKNVEIEQLIQ